MAKKQLIVTLRADGSVEAETAGMTGDACLDYISVLEDMLDAETAESKFTPEYTSAAQQQRGYTRQQNEGSA